MFEEAHFPTDFNLFFIHGNRGKRLSSSIFLYHSVTATLTLYDNKDTILESWSASETYRATPNGTCKVEKGKTYTPVLTWSINGVSQLQTLTSKARQ